MAEQPEMDSPTDNSQEKSVEQKIYKSERDAVNDMKTLLGFNDEQSKKPEATENREVESEVSKAEEVTSEKNTDDLGEDAELVDLLEDETSETNEDFIELDGEKITLEELKKDRLRQKDYTQKTQKLSQERKAFEDERMRVKQEGDVAKQTRDLYEQRLGELQKALSDMPETNAVDLDKLYNEDPAEYVRQKAKIDKVNEAKAKVAEEQKQLIEIKKAEQDKIYQEYIVQERQKLGKALPIYADPEKGESYRQELIKFAQERGFSNEEISLLVDHRSVLLLADAFQYNKLKQSNLKRKQVNKIPKVLSTSKNSKMETPQSNKRFRSQMDKLKKTGSANDAKNVLLEMINNKAI